MNILILTLGILSLVSLGIMTMNHAYSQAQTQPSQNIMDIIEENADMTRGMASYLSENCVDSISAGNTKAMETCFQFAKDYNSAIKQVMTKYGIESEKKIDIEQLLKKYNLY